MHLRVSPAQTPMPDAESNVLRALDRLFLQQGVSRGKFILYYFWPAFCPLPVNRVLEKFEARIKSQFPNE